MIKDRYPKRLFHGLTHPYFKLRKKSKVEKAYICHPIKINE
jgi:hypothetical protein